MAASKDLKTIRKLLDARRAERPVWEMLVGRFMLAFGDIENATLLALERISSDSIMRTARSLLLAKRIELLTEILEAKEGISASARADFIETLARVKSLADKRNLIAHNPLILEFYEHGHTGELVSQGVIASTRNENKRINIGTMQKLVQQLEECRTLLFDQYGRISKELRLPQRRRNASKRSEPRRT